MNTFIKAAVIAGACGLASVAQAETPDDYFALDGYFVSHDERAIDAGSGFGGRLGIGGTLIRSGGAATGIEVGLFRNNMSSDVSSGDQQTGLMLDLTQTFVASGMEPYVFAGVGYVAERAGPADGAFMSMEVGGGLMFALMDYTLRVSLSAMSVGNDELEPGVDAYVDYRLSVGTLFGMAAGDKK